MCEFGSDHVLVVNCAANVIRSVAMLYRNTALSAMTNTKVEAWNVNVPAMSGGPSQNGDSFKNLAIWRIESTDG